MMRVAADLHIHTALSPCASPDMTPPAIAAQAARRRLGMIAVCDHNSAGNVPAVRAAAAAVPDGPFVVPGMEITTREEAHVLGLFPTPDGCAAAAAEVAATMAEGLPARLSSAVATGLSLGATVDLIHRHGGLAIAAHVDRRTFSVPGQLGFLPADVPFDAIEISSAGVRRGRAPDFAALGLPLVSSSDAHFPEDIGTGVTILDVEGPGFDELVLALRGRQGRRCGLA
jgi:predicted metal-dependent phosphoesterase TrpH